MAILVTLHVFSGRPNPIWALPSEEESALLDAVKDIGGRDAPPTRGLGYQGFSLLSTSADDSRRGLLFENQKSDEVRGSFLTGHPDLEDRLLQSGRDVLDDDLLTYVRQEVESGPDMAVLEQSLATRSCPPCGGGAAPPYNPNYWNNNQIILNNNNCYNYANNQVTNTFAQPGRGTGQMYTALTCPDVAAAADRDGLVSTGGFSASVQGWYVALVIWPNRDFHWYRQDSNGCWSHKPGSTPVRNTDNSGNPITDPATCNRGPYTSFCTYFVTGRSVRIA